MCQDMRDDMKAGVKSVALRLGENLRRGLSIVVAIFFLAITYAGFMNDQLLSFYVVGAAAPTLLCLWHVWTFNPHDPEDSRRKFIVSFSFLSEKVVINYVRHIVTEQPWCAQGLPSTIIRNSRRLTPDPRLKIES